MLLSFRENLLQQDCVRLQGVQRGDSRLTGKYRLYKNSVADPDLEKKNVDSDPKAPNNAIINMIDFFFLNFHTLLK